MKTEQLISVLSSDTHQTSPIRLRLSSFVGVAMLISGLAALTALGVRADLTEAVRSPATLMKWVLPLAAALPALIALPALWQPQTRRVPLLRVSAFVGLAALVWLLATGMATPASDLLTTWRGSSRAVCLISIVLTSLLPLGAAIFILRDGASAAPMLCGASAGLVIGGLATSIYALHCVEDAPLFFLTWYSLAILIVTGIGALAGAKFLRW